MNSLIKKFKPPDKEYVFTYGTLKGRYSLDQIPALLLGKYYIDHSDMYPMIKSSKYLNEIQGHIFSIDTDELKVIDNYEGYPDFYQRISLEILTEIGRVQAWVYLSPEIVKKDKGN